MVVWWCGGVGCGGVVECSVQAGVFVTGSDAFRHFTCVTLLSLQYFRHFTCVTLLPSLYFPATQVRSLQAQLAAAEEESSLPMAAAGGSAAGGWSGEEVEAMKLQLQEAAAEEARLKAELAAVEEAREEEARARAALARKETLRKSAEAGAV